MDWEWFAGNWPRMRGQMRHRWGRLSEEDLDRIAGQRETFLRLVEERYAVNRAEARQRIEEWLRSLEERRVLTGR